MDLGLNGKIALVTAASQGIGLAAARGLALEGARLAICARDAAVLEAAAAAIRAEADVEVRAIPCDLTDPQAIDAMVRAVIEHYGTVHVLVNNAGGPPPGASDRLGDEEWRRAFELTLMSAVRTTRAVLPAMRRQRWGRIVNVSSFSVKQPIPDLLLSNALRLGVLGWAKTLAGELAAENVLVNTVAPGWTRTDRVTQMLASRSKAGGATPEEVEASITRTIPMARFAEPAEIADVIVFLASARASYVTGTVLPVDGGAVRTPT